MAGTFRRIFLVLACAAVAVIRIDGQKYLANEYEYSLSRDKLLKAEEKFENRDTTLTPKEQTVDRYLQYLKWREFKATKDSGFPPSRPIEEKLAYILTTEIYKALIKFPKGGNMHSHEDHDVSKRTLIDIVWSKELDPICKYLFMLPPDHPTAPWSLDYFVNPPENKGWIQVDSTNYTKEEILKQQSLLGILTDDATRYPTDSGKRWNEMNALWGKGSTQLIAHIDVKKRYIMAMYEAGYNQGVIYFETRKSAGKADRIYELDPSGDHAATNGKKFLDEGGDLDVEIALNASKEFAQTHPGFVGHKRISYSYRQNSLSDFDADMMNLVRLRNLYPDHYLGFDTVGQEDAGYSLLHYLGEFMKLNNSDSEKPNVPLYLHASETSWPYDLLTTDQDDDLVATDVNSYEALLLNSVRIAHGEGFIKHPYLLKLLRDRNIPIETCLVSNQLLGFTPDIRHHPALHYHRSGIAVMLGSDDAGTFGYDNITVDWYEAFMAWGLDLRDLRTFALNSLQYSGLSDTDKKDAINNKWKPMWDTYIAETYTTACARNYITEAANENRATTFAGILPKEGAKKGSTKVHIFGRNFEQGICKNVMCKFGDKVSTAAVYVSNQHIVCQSPAFRDQQEHTVDVSVSLDGGTYVSTGFSFSYKFA